MGMLRNNLLSLNDYVKDAATRNALLQVHEGAGNWIDILDSTQLRLMKARITELLAEIRPDAVALVDGFGWTDKDLKSTLGRHDGNVYEAIYSQAKSGKLN